MNKIESISKNFYDPFWWKQKAFPYAKKELVRKYLKYRYSPSAPECYLMDEDWDNLILLDACRCDQFDRYNTLVGDLEYRTSLGSATPEFLMENFAGSTYHDTVYVTANPMYRTKNLDDIFHDIIDVWETDWNSEQRTVQPEKVVMKTLEAYHKYPQKRIIAHFMQPHYPFIGETAKELGTHSGIEMTYRSARGEAAERDHPTVWSLLENDEINEETVWKAYNENLEIALDHIEDLIDEFSEKTVVTSDHGNFVGERVVPFGKPKYGHPVGVYADELRKVPWLMIDGDERKTIRSEKPANQVTSDEEKSEASSAVTDRLADLGYVNQ